MRLIKQTRTSKQIGKGCDATQSEGSRMNNMTLHIQYIITKISITEQTLSPIVVEDNTVSHIVLLMQQVRQLDVSCSGSNFRT